jgi:hypothetical protein
MDVKGHIRRLATLKGQRQPHEQGWQECLNYSFPERAQGLNGSTVTANSSQDAQSQKNRILDDTAADSARTLGSSIVSGTTPANSLWFGLDAGLDENNDAMSEEGRWLDSGARTIFENIHQSNFDAAAYECAIDLTAAGWFVLYIDAAKEGGYHFEQWPIAQCFICSSRLGGLVDTIYREVEMTVEQVVAEYGVDKVSKKTADCYRAEKFDEKVLVCHAIYPRQIHIVGAKRAKNLPFASIHFEVSAQHIIRESGYHEFPCVVPRWVLIPGSAYATGPMSNALGSIRSVNDIKALELANLDVAVAGMWIAEDDGVLNPRAVKLGPRRIIVANSVESMKELRSGADFNVAFSAEDRLQAAIRKAMLADQLQPQDGPAMTATEVHVRVQLIRQLLGPIYGRLQAEYLKPLIDRCFGIAYRAGVLGQAPESLQGKIFTVKYLSPLARAQRLEDVTAMDRFEASLIAEAQADPTVLDVYDFEMAARERSSFLGVPQRVMRSPTKVAELRDAREQKNAEQQADAMGQEMLSRAAPELVKQAVAA